MITRLITDAAGTRWRVVAGGRRTQYSVDECTLVFQQDSTAGGEERIARFSPRLEKSPAEALAQLSDAALAALLTTSQPRWTSPDGGYAGRP